MHYVPRSGLLQTELVALGILHHHPKLAALLDRAKLRGAQPDEPSDFGLDPCTALFQRHFVAAPDVEIDVNTILDSQVAKPDGGSCCLYRRAAAQKLARCAGSAQSITT